MKILIILIIIAVAIIIYFLRILYKACRISFKEVNTRLNYLECDHLKIEVIGVKSEKVPSLTQPIEIEIETAHFVCNECGLEWYKDVQYLECDERSAYFLFRHKRTQLKPNNHKK